MQTFLPFADFKKSAFVLDDTRLGNQRREALGLINAVTGKSKGWRNHPAALMWTGYSSALRLYYDTIVAEWIARGFTHNGQRMRVVDPVMPWWLGDERVHSSHRAALLAKKPGWYEQFGWSEKPVIDYHWPVTRMPDGFLPVGAPVRIPLA